jgi:F420-dependent oxidoreductase-like protein
MRICLMVEGQEGVTWDDWLALAGACERYGFEALFRSDHYLSVQGRPERDALEAWATIAALAARTERLRLGTLVSPVTFRHPSVLAKLVVTADHVSGGRVELGLGTGWSEPEHRAFGFPLPPPAERMDLLAEQLEVVHGIWTRAPFDHQGARYRLSGLDARPRPVQQPHPPLLVGGEGGRRSLALAARWADEYNTIRASVEDCRARHERLRAAFAAAGRDPASARLSLMTTCIVGADRAEVAERAGQAAARVGERDLAAYVAKVDREGVIGTVEQALGRLAELEAAGVSRVMLRHLVHDDLDMVTLLGREVLPNVSRAG